MCDGEISISQLKSRLKNVDLGGSWKVKGGEGAGAGGGEGETRRQREEDGDAKKIKLEWGREV